MLVGYEVLIIGGVILVLLLWGPKKIPELARSLGEAKHEFDQAKKAVAEPLRIEEEKR